MIHTDTTAIAASGSASSAIKMTEEGSPSLNPAGFGKASPSGTLSRRLHSSRTLPRLTSLLVTALVIALIALPVFTSGALTLLPANISGPTLEVTIRSGIAYVTGSNPTGSVYDVTGTSLPQSQVREVPITTPLVLDGSAGSFASDISVKGQAAGGAVFSLELKEVTLTSKRILLDTGTSTQLVIDGAVVVDAGTSAGAAISLNTEATLSLVGKGQAPKDSLKALGALGGAGIGSDDSATTSGAITINDDALFVYAKGNNNAGIGSHTPGERIINLTAGSIAAVGDGTSSPAVGGAGRVVVGSNATAPFIVAYSEDNTTPALGAHTSNPTVIASGSIYSNTGITAPRSTAGANFDYLYPLYVPETLAEDATSLVDTTLTIPETGPVRTISAAQQDWFFVENALDPLPHSLQAIAYVPAGIYDNTISVDGTPVASANVQETQDAYLPPQWTNSLGSAVRINLTQVGGADNAADSTGLKAIFSPNTTPFSITDISDFTLHARTGAADLATGASALTTSDNLEFDLALERVLRQGSISLDVVTPVSHAQGWALLDYPASTDVYKTPGSVTNTSSRRYATPVATIHFDGQDGAQGVFFYKVLERGETGPATPLDLRDAPGVSSGPFFPANNKFVIRNLTGNSAKTVWVTGAASQAAADAGLLTPLETIDIDSFDGHLTITDTSASLTVGITAANANGFRLTGLQDDATGEWSLLNSDNPLYLTQPVAPMDFGGPDAVNVVLDTLTATDRRINITGYSTTATHANPLRLTLKDCDWRYQATHAIVISNQTNLDLNIEGANTVYAGQSGSPASAIFASANMTLGRLNIYSTTAGRFNAQGYSYPGIYGSGVNMIFGGDVRLRSAHEAGNSSQAFTNGGATGHVRVQDTALVHFRMAGTINSSTTSIGGNFTVADNPILIVDPPSGQSDSLSANQVRIEGGFVVARTAAGNITGHAIRAANGQVVITGGSVYSVDTVKGITGIQNPVDASGTPLYPLYVPARLNDGTDLTDTFIGGGNLPYSQRTITEAQRALMVTFGAAGYSYPSVPSVAADFTSGRMAACVWVPADYYTTAISSSSGLIAADVVPVTTESIPGSAPIAPATYVHGQSYNVLGIPKPLSASFDGTFETATSTELTVDFSAWQAIPGINAQDWIHLAKNEQRALINGDLTTTDSGLTYTVPVTGVTGNGKTYVALRLPAAYAGFVPDSPGLKTDVHQALKIVLEEGRTWRARQNLGIAGFGSSHAGYTYYAYIDEAANPAPPNEAFIVSNAQQTGILAQGEISTINANSIGVAFAGGLDTATAKKVYIVAIKNDVPLGTSDPNYYSNIATLEIPAWVTSPTEPLMLQSFINSDVSTIIAATTVAATPTIYRLTGMTGEAGAFNNQDLFLAHDSIELHKITSPNLRLFTINGNSVAPTAPLHVTLFETIIAQSTVTGGAPLHTRNRAQAVIHVEGTEASSLTGFNTSSSVGTPGLGIGSNTTVTITSASGARLNSTGGGGNATTGIGGDSVVSTSMGNLTIEGNVRINARAGGSASYGGAGIGGLYTASGSTAVVTIRDNAFVYAQGTNMGGIAHAGISQADQGTVNIEGNATVVTSGATASKGSIEGKYINISDNAFIVTNSAATSYGIGSAASASEVTISGGSIWCGTAGLGIRGIYNPVNTAGDALYPLYVPARLNNPSTSVQTDVTDSVISGGNLPYAQRTITAEQRTWIAGFSTAWMPIPSVPSVAADYTTPRPSACLWVPTDEEPAARPNGSVYEAVITPTSGGTATNVAGYVRPLNLAWGTTTATAITHNIIAHHIGITSAIPDGSAGTVDSTKYDVKFSSALLNITQANVYLQTQTGSGVSSGTPSTLNTGLDWTVPVTPAADGSVGLVVSTRNQVAHVPTTINKNNVVTLSNLSATRYFDTIAGNLTYSSNSDGTLYYWFGDPGVAVDTTWLVANGTQAPLSIGNSEVIDGITYDAYLGSNTIPVWAVAESAQGTQSTLEHFDIPAFSGEWFVIPAGVNSTQVRLVADSVTRYHFEGFSETGKLDWLNNRPLTMSDTPVELRGTNVNGTRSFIVDGSNIVGTNEFRLRLNSVTLTSPNIGSVLQAPFGVLRRGNAWVTVDGTNAINGSVIGVDSGPCLQVDSSSKLTMTSTSNGRVTATVSGSSGGSAAFGGHGGHGGSFVFNGNVQIAALSANHNGNHGAPIGGSYGFGLVSFLATENAQIYAYVRSNNASAIGGAGSVSTVQDITIGGNAIVVARLTRNPVPGIGSGTNAGANTSITVAGNPTVIVDNSDTTSRAIGGASAKIQITGGNIYTNALSSDQIGSAANPPRNGTEPVYPLYIPASFDGWNLKNKVIAAPDLPYSQRTITPAAEAWLATYSIGSFWPSDLAACLWVPENVAMGSAYDDFTQDGSSIMALSGYTAKAVMDSDQKLFTTAQTSLRNILTGSLNNVVLTQDGVANVATTKMLTFTAQEITNISSIAIVPSSLPVGVSATFGAIMVTSDRQVQIPITGTWPEGAQIMVRIAVTGINTDIAPPVFRLTLHRDMTPPVITVGSVERLTHALDDPQVASLKFAVNEEGTYTYIVLPAGAAAPTQAQVLNPGTYPETVEGSGSGTVNLSGNSISVDIPSGDLTGRDVYIVATDLEGLRSMTITPVKLPAMYQLAVDPSILTTTGLPGGGTVDATTGFPENNGIALNDYHAEGSWVVLNATPSAGNGFVGWEIVSGGGTFRNINSATTSFQMPSKPATIRALFAPMMEFVSAAAGDGAADTKTTTYIDLEFTIALTPAQLSALTVGIYDEGGDNLSPVFVSSAISDETTQATGPFIYRVPIDGVLAETTITVRPQLTGIAFAPFQIGSVRVHYDATPPEVEVTVKDRLDVTDARVQFSSNESGIYHYLILSTGGAAPTAADIKTSGISAAMTPGTNTLTISTLPDGREYTVWIVAGDEQDFAGERNWTEVIGAPLQAFGNLSVLTAGGADSVAGTSGNYLAGSHVSITATAATYYEFVEWIATIEGSPKPNDIADVLAIGSLSTDRSATITMPSVPTTITAIFKKSDITVIYDSSFPATGTVSAPTYPNSTSRIGEIIEDPDVTLIPGTAYGDHRFVGWFSEPFSLDTSPTISAWIFDLDTIDTSLITGVHPGPYSVTLYAVWVTDDEYVADPISYGPESCSTCHYASVAKEHQRTDSCSTCHSSRFSLHTVTNWNEADQSAHASFAAALNSAQSCGLATSSCHARGTALEWHGYRHQWNGTHTNPLTATHSTDISENIGTLSLGSEGTAAPSGCTGSTCHNRRVRVSETGFGFGDMDLASAHNDYWSAVNEIPVVIAGTLTTRTVSASATPTSAMTSSDNPYGCGLCHDRSAEGTSSRLRPSVQAVVTAAGRNLSCTSCHLPVAPGMSPYTTDPTCTGGGVVAGISGRALGISGASSFGPTTDVSKLLDALSPQAQLGLGTNTSPLQPGVGVTSK